MEERQQSLEDLNGFQKALFFIPDISGFTSFTYDVEIEHSAHIISELLKVLLEANQLELRVSEIEGDAILFYRLGKPSSQSELARQAEVMFLNFHQHLLHYKQNRICQCGACSTAHRLTLKFITHHGKLTIRRIQAHRKLFGPDVILVHRLLKNSIPVDEYLLITESIPPDIGQEESDWNFEKGEDTYERIGPVQYRYFPMRFLRKKVPAESPPADYKDYGELFSVSRKIPSSLKRVHRLVTDIDLKSKWYFGVRAIRREQNKLDVVGSRHKCILPLGAVDLEIASQKVEKGVIEYVERTRDIPWIGPLNIIITMKRINEDETHVSIRAHFRKSGFTRWRLDILFRILMAPIFNFSLRKLKALAIRINEPSPKKIVSI